MGGFPALLPGTALAARHVSGGPTLATCRGCFCSLPPCSLKPQGAPPVMEMQIKSPVPIFAFQSGSLKGCKRQTKPEDARSAPGSCTEAAPRVQPRPRPRRWDPSPGGGTRPRGPQPTPASLAFAQPPSGRGTRLTPGESPHLGQDGAGSSSSLALRVESPHIEERMAAKLSFPTSLNSRGHTKI